MAVTSTASFLVPLATDSGFAAATASLLSLAAGGTNLNTCAGDNWGGTPLSEGSSGMTSTATATGGENGGRPCLYFG